MTAEQNNQSENTDSSVTSLNIPDFDRYDQLVSDRDMAEAYITITSQMGPSAQLLAFVNFDGKLGQELGVGLESMSVMEQHEALIQKLDVDKMDDLATEALVDNIRHAADGLKFAARETQKAYLLGGHKSLGVIGNVGQLVAHTALAATNHLVVNVEAYDDMIDVYNDTVELYKLEQYIADMLPNGFTEEEWTEFHKNVNPAIRKYNAKWFSWGLAVPRHELTYHLTEWKHAGWSDTKVNYVQGKIDALRKEVRRLSGRYADKLDAVDKFLRSQERAKGDERKAYKRTHATINKLIVSTHSMFYRTYQRIDQMQFHLNEVKEHLKK